jgi:hypothetical protein
MGWPRPDHPESYVYMRTCVRCGKEFRGFAASKYCSPECIELTKMARQLAKWGLTVVPRSEKDCSN